MPRNTIKGSVPLFTFQGIGVLVHWSFLLLIGYVAYKGWQAGQDLRGIGGQMLYLVIVFACVVMHEYGHALTAKRYGIGTRDITLLPIGGVASLERMPEEPRQEFFITLAGPAVNLVLVIIAVALQLIFFQRLTILTDDLTAFPTASSLLSFLIVINLGLFIFNLVPAFPMDGGRILRSLLSMWLGRSKATRIASIVGKLFAAIFIVWGLFDNPFLILIGVFVYFGAAQEYRMVKRRSSLSELTVRDIMRTEFCTVEKDLTVDSAMAELLMAKMDHVMVMDHGTFLGAISREELVVAFRAGNGSAPLSALSILASPSLSPTARADEAHTIMLTERASLLSVLERGKLVGVVMVSDVLGRPSGNGT